MIPECRAIVVGSGPWSYDTYECLHISYTMLKPSPKPNESSESLTQDAHFVQISVIKEWLYMTL